MTGRTFKEERDKYFMRHLNYSVPPNRVVYTDLTHTTDNTNVNDVSSSVGTYLSETSTFIDGSTNSVALFP